MSRDDIRRMAVEAGAEQSGEDPPSMCLCGMDLFMFTELVATHLLRKQRVDIERWKAEAATAEKWRGMALSRASGSQVVQHIQREAASAEREACAKVLDQMANEAERDGNSIDIVAYYRSQAKMVRARGAA